MSGFREKYERWAKETNDWIEAQYLELGLLPGNGVGCLCALCERDRIHREQDGGVE